MNISEVINSRYTTKSFDPDQKIPADDFAKIMEVLRMSPSSTNLQPWHFVIADDKAGLARIAKGAEGFYSFNQEKIINASHAVVFACKTYADDQHLAAVLEQERQDGRYQNEEMKTKVDTARRYFLGIHRNELKDETFWHSRQIYLNLGAVLLTAAMLGIDTCPMEGLDFKVLNEEFDLPAKGYTALVAAAFGYRAEDDFNTPDKMPKSRLGGDYIFSRA
ncbi:MAG: oxygen-insensitive NAD(P)H nitroreductase [Deltaproteobacteria bacterium]|nr:MAG: oxygen-insensitive NAD(P)H nitroreductase [Deltaproteobacteria bacterium]